MDLPQIYQIFRNSTGLTTDTRKIASGNLFLALKGENFDGNQFAVEAIQKGALATIVSDPKLADNPQCIWVEDTLKTLQGLGNYHRKQLTIPVLAITGSNGKTTTKELISAVLSTKYRCHATTGNYNNHIGVPLTLLEMPIETEIAVIEMGANHQGEIAVLARIAEPSHGLITNIGKAHLEGFGGIEGVKKGKGELYDFLAATNGVAFVNMDEKYLPELALKVKNRVPYQQGVSDQLTITPIAINPFVAVKVQTQAQVPTIIKSQLFGQHNLNNIMTAIAVGNTFQVPIAQIREAIEAYIPQNNRSQLIKQGSNQIFLDAYNANPTSVKMALTHFAQTNFSPKIALLGSMLELGEYSDQEHEEIASLAIKLGIEHVILVGEQFRSAARKLSLLHFMDVQALRSWWQEQKFEHAGILIKGSRGIKLEQVLSNE